MAYILIVGGQHRAAKQYAEELMAQAKERGEPVVYRRRSNRFQIGDQKYAFYGDQPDQIQGWGDGTQVITVVSADISSNTWRRIYAICLHPQEAS